MTTTATFDIKIAGGEIIDGSGTPPRCADVGVRAGRIETVGDLRNADARKVLDASGLCVTPGFIDVHSHSDAYLLVEPSAPSKIFQGVTTEVVGNCGASAAPRYGASRMPSDWADKPYPGSWTTVAEYRRLLDSVRPAVNVVLLIGHNTLRAGAVGHEDRPATPDELARMEAVLEQALEEGGRGFSTGLIYPPGMFAPREELVALARVAARHNGVYASHMRSEGRRLLDAIDEAIAIGAAAGLPVEISHLKTSGRANWPLLGEALDRIRTAREDGTDVCADRYPYTSSCTDLDVVFPNWAQEGGRDAVLARLRDASTRARLRDELLAARGDDYWPTVTIGTTAHPDNLPFRGMPLPEVAARLGLHPVDAVLHMAESDGLKTSAFFFGMSEANMKAILDEPYVALGSDASVRAPTGPLSRDYPHPRAYGSFPRFLRMALDGETVPLPEAVRKMTDLPARHFGLAGRGRIERGMLADIVVFDPGSVRDAATYAAPHRLADGIRHVVVNGVLTLADRRYTGDRGGLFL